MILLTLIFTLLLIVEGGTASNYANVLIYSFTAGYRHDSIPTAVASLTARGPSQGIYFTNSEEPSDFTDEYLSQFDALFFLSTTDEVLDASGQRAFQRYLDSGGNFIGAHAASNCLFNFTTMEKVLGSTFAYHPEFTTATMVVSGPSHPSTEGLPHRWQVQDEIYNFVQDPRDEGAIVVLTADETSYNDPGDRSPSQGTPHPITWYQEHLKGTNTTGPIGRSWYTGLGHSNASWVDDTFLGHVLGGISWALASNTTRWINPAGTVGSLGPIYETPAEAAPTTTLDSDSSALSLPQPLGLSSLLVGITCLLVASWSL